MSHNININEKTGKASFMSVKQPAWHNLGQVVTDAPNSEEAIKLAGLDYQVEKAPVTVTTTKGDIIEVPDRFVTVRTDTNQTFDFVSTSYKVLQNQEAFNFFDEIVGQKLAIFQTAGALGKGETVFISAKLPSFVKLRVNGKEDVIEKYLLLMNNHSGRMSIKAVLTPVRVVCNNTLRAALSTAKEGDSVAIPHLGDLSRRLKDAAAWMGMVNTKFEKSQQIYERLASVKISDKKLTNYINKLFPAQMREDGTIAKQVQDNREGVLKYYFEGAGQDFIQGTAWGAYNALTGFVHNVKDMTAEQEIKAHLKPSVLSKALDFALAMS